MDVVNSPGRESSYESREIRQNTRPIMQLVTMQPLLEIRDYWQGVLCSLVTWYRYKVANFIVATVQSCYGSKLLIS